MYCRKWPCKGNYKLHERRCTKGPSTWVAVYWFDTFSAKEQCMLLYLISVGAVGFYHGCYWVFLYLTILCFMALTGVHSYRGGECYLLPTNYLLYPNPWSGQEMQCPQLGFFSSKARSSTTTQPHHKNMKISLFKRRKKF